MGLMAGAHTVIRTHTASACLAPAVISWPSKPANQRSNTSGTFREWWNTRNSQDRSLTILLADSDGHRNISFPGKGFSL